MQPILDLVCEATGWKATFIAGGPEPADGGRMNCVRYVGEIFCPSYSLTFVLVSVHSGTTLGDVQLDFGKAERERYKKFFLPMYGAFLKKCYSKLLSLRCNVY